MSEAQGVLRGVYDPNARALRVTAHAASVVTRGTLAAIPAASTVQNNALYIAHDNSSYWFNNNGTWVEVRFL